MLCEWYFQNRQKENVEENNLKVMIVEDETVIRNGLAKHIMWKDFGINEVKAVENA